MLYNDREFRRRPYMIITYNSVPVKGAPTHIKDWAKAGNQWQMHEAAHFHDSLKDKMVMSAHVIIDVLNARVTKNRFDHVPDDQVFKHFMEKYGKQASEACSVFFQKYPEKLQRMIAMGKETAESVETTENNIAEDTTNKVE